MEVTLALLYRGALASCNYTCGYCPFTLERPSSDELARDAAALERFTGWARDQRRSLALFFTPRGEGLTRDWYRHALVELSHLRHVREVVIQTNGSCDFTWLERCDRDRLALWLSFHPDQVDLRAFAAKCRGLYARGVRFSVGVVGTREQIDSAGRLRALLPADVYLWINAYKDGGPNYYRAAEVEALTALDPLFPMSLTPHDSLGSVCRTGASVISVDGEGEVRRCHFVAERLGNLYRDDLDAMLKDRPCPNRECSCHIGYVHLEALGLYEVFGAGVLARIPARRIGADTPGAILYKGVARAAAD